MLRRHRPHALHELHEQTDARIADLKDARDREVKQLNRLVEAMAEQVEYLRVQLERTPKLGQPIKTGPHEYDTLELPEFDPTSGPLPYIGDEEEDIRFLHEVGALDTVQLQTELERIGADGPLDD
jgi:hypothetical protein